MAAVVNHLGHCVTDLQRARAFYEDVFGFEFWREIKPPDTPSDQLLRLTPPIDMTACYLRRDGVVLELLRFAGDGARPGPATPRVMNEVGLTHLSFSVDDIAETCASVAAHGGEVLDDTNIGFGVFVRDPEGQLIELLPMAYHDSLDG
ncbi:MAG TPA: VOC family protein [Acidimicrobiia bacterium]|nr:VOC family protein [Acidimicrobiia bacterium]